MSIYYFMRATCAPPIERLMPCDVIGSHDVVVKLRNVFADLTAGGGANFRNWEWTLQLKDWYPFRNSPSTYHLKFSILRTATHWFIRSNHCDSLKLFCGFLGSIENLSPYVIFSQITDTFWISPKTLQIWFSTELFKKIYIDSKILYKVEISW